MEHGKPTSGSPPARSRSAAARQRSGREWLDELDSTLRESKDLDIETLKARLREQLETARTAMQDVAGAAAGAAGGYMREAVECTDDYVRTRPWQALGWVALGAFLAGVCASRR